MSNIVKKGKQLIKSNLEIFEHQKEIKCLITEIENIEKRIKAVNASVIFISIPNVDRLNNLTEEQYSRIRNWTFDFNNIGSSEAKLIKTLYGDSFSLEHIIELFQGVKVFEQNGCHYLADYSSQYVNILNGHRFTIGQPDAYSNTIFVYGSCTARGTGVEDSMTIESYMQAQLNEKHNNMYRVENCGVGCGYYLKDDFQHILETKIGSGDIVIILEPFKTWETLAIGRTRVPYFDLSKAFNDNAIKDDWFLDYTGHTLPKGNFHIANFIFDELIRRELLTNNEISHKRYTEIVEKYVENAELNVYLDQLKKIDRNTNINGAIVMNCNPFTMGHRYLIESAAAQVDTLYIFVVEENRSFFSFEDRIDLVKKGCSDLANVIVVPSGKFIISASTFPGYFNKDYDNTIEVDTSEDVSIFGNYIAKTLNITKRFVGEEPLDAVTNQYNESMKKILPEFGVELIEIPRKTSGEGVISASRVRKYLKEKDFEEIKKIVPKTTFEYLEEKFGND